MLSDYGHEVADKMGYTDKIDENGCIERKVYWDLVRSAKRGRLEKSLYYLHCTAQTIIKYR
jgi:ERCC4-type nuclease